MIRFDLAAAVNALGYSGATNVSHAAHIKGALIDLQRTTIVCQPKQPHIRMTWDGPVISKASIVADQNRPGRPLVATVTLTPRWTADQGMTILDARLLHNLCLHLRRSGLARQLYAYAASSATQSGATTLRVGDVVYRWGPRHSKNGKLMSNSLPGKGKALPTAYNGLSHLGVLISSGSSGSGHEEVRRYSLRVPSAWLPLDGSLLHRPAPPKTLVANDQAESEPSKKHLTHLLIKGLLPPRRMSTARKNHWSPKSLMHLVATALRHETGGSRSAKDIIQAILPEGPGYWNDELNHLDDLVWAESAHQNLKSGIAQAYEAV